MGWRIWGSVPGRGKKLVFFELSRPALRSTQPTLQRVLEASSPGLKRQALLHLLLSLRLYGSVPPLPRHAFVMCMVTSVEVEKRSILTKESPRDFNVVANL